MIDSNDPRFMSVYNALEIASDVPAHGPFGRHQTAAYVLAQEVYRLRTKCSLDVLRERNVCIMICEQHGGEAAARIASEIRKRFDVLSELNKVSHEASNKELELRHKQLMLIFNFPSHPGGHKMDLSSNLESPEDWRDGWTTAVHAMQKAVLDAAS